MEKIVSNSGNGRRVVVIGGGIAGSRVTKYLQFETDLTLIDPLQDKPGSQDKRQVISSSMKEALPWMVPRAELLVSLLSLARM